MQKKIERQSQSPKPFTWSVSSASFNFVHSSELQSARDGSDTGGCGSSNISPLRPAKDKLSKMPSVMLDKSVH